MNNAKIKIVAATGNAGKLKEIAARLAGLPIDLLSLKDIENPPEIIENGQTFVENSLIKAHAIFKHTGLPTLADDSGLTVAELGGAPGIYSARYSGDNADDSSNNALLLKELDGVPAEKRNAAFVCAIAFVAGGIEKTFEARWEGQILEIARGEGGFGYDPLFLDKELGRTAAELPVAEKNLRSHRGKALDIFASFIKSEMESGTQF